MPKLPSCQFPEVVIPDSCRVKAVAVPSAPIWYQVPLIRIGIPTAACGGSHPEVRVTAEFDTVAPPLGIDSCPAVRNLPIFHPLSCSDGKELGMLVDPVDVGKTTSIGVEPFAH